jgi:hypothetical protein
MNAHNWRKRAEQMRVIADSVESGRVRDYLTRKAEGFTTRAEEAEREDQAAAGNKTKNSPQ